MQYTRVTTRGEAPRRDSMVYADLDELVRLQFEAQGFSFLPRQPLHSMLHGSQASRLRGCRQRATDWKRSWSCVHCVMKQASHRPQQQGC
jgi:hypothetical protein